jgi:phosphoglycolate phosphatase-like HAD superfamily hydrolase
MIPKEELKALADAIRAAVNEHGHPDNLEQADLKGVSEATAEKAFALLTSELFPADKGEAVAKWLRLIGDFNPSTNEIARRFGIRLPEENQ